MRLIVWTIIAAALAMVAGCGAAKDTALIPSLEQLAANGNAEAIYHLGMAYQT